MKRKVTPAVTWSGFCFLLVLCVGGCGEARQSSSTAGGGQTALAATTGQQQESAHDDHTSAAQLPQDFPAGIVALRRHYQAIKDAFRTGDVEKAHEPLHEVGEVLEALPKLATAAGLSAENNDKIQQAVTKMFDAYGAVDGALHDGKRADYQSVARTLDENMALLDAFGPPAAPGEQPLRLAFITCCKDAPFFEPVKKGMQDAAEKMGVECTWIGIEGVDMPAQAQLVAQAAQEKYDGIAVNLVDPEAFDKVVEDAMQQGIPVVGFNTDDHATPNRRMSCVNQRLYEAGRALAAHVAADIPEGAHVLMTMHDKGVSSLEDRLRGLQEELTAKNVRWTVCITGNDSAKGAEVIEQELRKATDIRVVLSTGQADTEAAGRAIEKSFAGQEYWAAGFDLSPTTLRLIKANHIRCTVDQQPYIQGFYPVVQLTLYLRYGIVPTSIDAGATIITAETADRTRELTEQKYR